jgi:hypothetical protein
MRIPRDSDAGPATFENSEAQATKNGREGRPVLTQRSGAVARAIDAALHAT